MQTPAREKTHPRCVLQRLPDTFLGGAAWLQGAPSCTLRTCGLLFFQQGEVLSADFGMGIADFGVQLGVEDG